MEAMVEPDRTIMIVSIIGLVIIWGSVFYHKFVQGGGSAQAEPEPEEAAGGPASQGPAEGQGGQRRKRKR